MRLSPAQFHHAIFIADIMSLPGVTQDLVTDGGVATIQVYTQNNIDMLHIPTSTQIITEPPVHIAKYLQDINSQSNIQHCEQASITKERTPISCKACDYKTFYKHAFDRHMKTVHDKLKFYQCLKCDYKTSHNSALKRHESKVHDKSSQDLYRCPDCDYTTVHKSAVKRHIANRHQRDNQTLHECSICDYSTTYEFALQRHCTTVHLKEGVYECEMCEYNTVHKHALDRHIRMVHEKPATLSCDQCDYKAAHKSSLRLHLATVHYCKQTYKCDKCGYETLYKTALNRHQSTVVCGQGEKVTGAAALDRLAQTNVTHVIMDPADDVKKFTITSKVPKQQVLYESKDSDGATIWLATDKVDQSQVLPVSVANIVPITMIEKNGVMHTVNQIQLPGPVPVVQTRSDGLEYNIGEIVQVVGKQTPSQ